MIGEALRRLYVRYFRPAATSVSPKSVGIENLYAFTTDTELDAIIERMKARGLIVDDLVVQPIPPGPYVDPHQRGAEPEPFVGPTMLRDHPVQIESGAVDTRPGVKPPLDQQTDGWTWQQWEREVESAGIIEGWAFCRFANRLGETSVGFVFGYARGSFGVWQQPFRVCKTVNGEVENTTEILTCLTHLRSGLGIGIFENRDVAFQAAMLADRISAMWMGVKPDDAVWQAVTASARDAWDSVGIRMSSNAHCHDDGGTAFGIYGCSLQSIMDGKPEKFS